MEFLILLIVLSAILVPIGWGIFGAKQRRFAVNDSTFRQAGVTVDMCAATITIDKRRYPASAVRSTRWESGELGNSRREYSAAYIEVDDFDKPSHRIQFSRPDDAEKFLQRLRLALRRCAEVPQAVMRD